MIMRNAGSSDAEEILRYGAYLTAVEFGTDMVATKVLGMRGISLHTDSTFGFLQTFGTNLAVYYVMEKTNLLDTVLDQFGDDDVQRAAANAVVYTLTQEVSFRLLGYFMQKTASMYGEKFNF